MELQNKTLRILIIKEIEGLYKFAGHEVTKDQVIEMASIIVSDYSKIPDNNFCNFIQECKKGKYGIITRNPIFLMALIDVQFSSCRSDPQPRDLDPKYDLIPNPNWVEPKRYSNAERF